MPSNDQIIGAIVRRLNESLASRSSMKIGKVIDHPKGYKVKVISGQYLDSQYGRVTNWWTWRRVNDGDSLGKEESGYGW